jgi:UDP-3-O-[3-hydroxymyristoyl] glucosamine N-acyltransferase
MITVKEIALLLDGDILGDDSLPITGLAKIEEAVVGSLSFIANPKYEKFLETTAASCVLISRKIDPTKFTKTPPAIIQLDDPYSSFVIAIEKFNPKKIDIDKGIASSAMIHSTTKIGKNCSIGHYVVVAENSVIGDNVILHPHVVIGRDVKIGNDCIIYPHVTIREECILGNRIIIQPGVVIGGDGFGFAPKKDKTYQKIPQLGIVVIEDDVEIQSNSTVDRATLGETRVKRGTKLDNMVQIAHNVVVGEDTVMAGGSMVAGSTKIGDRNMIGGNAAITGHTFTVEDVKIAGHSGVTGQLDTPGETYSGYPAKESRRWRRIEGATRQLPELLFEIRDMQKKILELEEEIKKLKK